MNIKQFCLSGSALNHKYLEHLSPIYANWIMYIKVVYETNTTSTYNAIQAVYLKVFPDVDSSHRGLELTQHSQHHLTLRETFSMGVLGT